MASESLITGGSSARVAIKQNSRPRIANNRGMSEPTIPANFDRLAERKNILSCRLHHLHFAGLWEGWKDPANDEWLHTCTIITGEPNEFVREIHTRMPVILPEEHHDAWLSGEAR